MVWGVVLAFRFGIRLISLALSVLWVLGLEIGLRGFLFSVLIVFLLGWGCILGYLF